MKMFKTLTISQRIGLLLALAAGLIIECGTWENEISIVGIGTGIAQQLKPELNMEAGLVSIVVVGLLYFRDIIDFQGMNKWDRLLVLAIDMFVMAAIYALFKAATPTTMLDSIRDKFANIMVLTFFFTMLVFGLKGISKIAILACMLYFGLSRLGRISQAMGVWGFLVILLLFASFYLQENIKLSQVGYELQSLYGKHQSQSDRRYERAIEAPPASTDDKVTLPHDKTTERNKTDISSS